MGEREPIRITSLDESFDDSMKALLAGTRLGSASATGTASVAERALGYLRETYGLGASADGVPERAARTGGPGGWLRGLARRFFVSRTYHATLVTLIADLARRQAELEGQLARTTAEQSDANDRAARVVFRLWGDYNHLVRVVLDHHLNRVFGAFQDHFEAFHANFGAFQTNFEAFQRHFETHDRGMAELTAALRKLEQAVHEMQGPHDDLVRTVSELLAARVREDGLARRIEALEGEHGGP